MLGGGRRAGKLFLILLKPYPEGSQPEFLHLKEEERERAREKSGKMCPLRVLLILLSATLAGFFVLRNLKPQPELNEERQEEDSPEEPLSLAAKVI